MDGVPYKGQPQNLLREYLVLRVRKSHEHIVKTGAPYKLIVRLYDDTGFKGSVTFARYDPPREAIDRLDGGKIISTDKSRQQFELFVFIFLFFFFFSSSKIQQSKFHDLN